MSKFSNINKVLPKVLSAAMSLTIVCSTVGVTAYSAGVEQSKPKTAQSDSAAKKKTAEDKSAKDAKKYSKEETVYVIAGADGTPQKVIVSGWIKNSAKADKIKDQSNLKDIENIKGDETYTIDENKMVEWGADGNDIYYKGNSTEQLPVGVSIKYELDGKAAAPKDLGGKSGKLKMTFTYTNRQYEEVTVNGKKEKIYVPFVMLTGMMLDNEKFSDVEVSNGKVINDGSHTYVAGFALPGLQESLNLKSDELELPSTVEVTANVKNFELATTLTIATNEVFNDVDTGKVDGKIDELKKELDKMVDGVDALTDGTSQLYSGLSTLLDKSGELIDGVNQLYSGSEKLKNGSSDLKDGAVQLNNGAGALDDGVASLQKGAGTLDNGAGALSSGANQVDSGVTTLQGYVGTLSQGLGTISSNSGQLKTGAKQVFATLLGEADKQIAAAGLSAESLTIENYATVLNALIGQLDEDKVSALAYQTAYNTVSATVNSQKDVIHTAVEAEVKKQVVNGVLAAAGLGLDSESYDAAVAAGQVPEEVQTQVSAAISTQMAGMADTIDAQTAAQISGIISSNMESDEVKTQISQAVTKAATGKKSLQALKAQLDSYNTFYNGIIEYTAGVDKANAGAQQILGGTVTLKDGTSGLASGAGQLKSGAGSLKSGADSLRSGTGSLKNGASALKAGTTELNSGAVQLFNGISSLKNGAGSLVDGVTQLKKGSQTLDSGMKKFKKEGVDAIVDAVDGDLKTLTERFKAVVKVSKNYKTFSGATDEMNGKVDFIFKTDSVKAEQGTTDKK